MSATAYSLVTEPRAALCVFRLLHNGVPMLDPVTGARIEHATLEALWLRAWKLSAELGTSIACFGVRRIWL